LEHIYPNRLPKGVFMLTNSSSASGGKKRIASRIVGITLAVSVALLAAGRASAQYGGGTGGTGGGTGGTYTPPSSGYGGSGKAIGIGVGAAASAGLLYLALHKSSVTGCVQPAEDGLRFVDEKKNTSYTLVSGDVLLKAGQRVQLRGSKAKNTAGAQTFTAKKLVKDLGSCDATTPAGAAPATTSSLKPDQP
jgi:hypothetical protein